MMRTPPGFDAAPPHTVIIVGASGFVGQNLVRRLKPKVERIIPVSRNGAAVAGISGCDLHALRQEAVDQATLLIDLAGYRYDALTFATTQASILSENVKLLCEIYEFCAAKKIKEVRRASSIAVYPAATSLLDDGAPLDLSKHPHDGEMMYGWSKRIGEIYADLFNRKLGVNTLNFRLSNPYGPYDSIDEATAHVVPAFVLRALKSESSFLVRGNPEASRDFIFVEDVCAVFEKSLQCRGTSAAYNVGSGKSTSIRELAMTVLELAGRTDKKIQVEGKPMTTVMHRRCRTERMQRDFEIAEFTSLHAGLAKTIAWYRDPNWR